jgi:polyphosphate glucokinase
MNVLTVDVGGTHVKTLVSGEQTPRKISSGPELTPEEMVSAVKKLTADWKYDVISIGYPGPVVNGRALHDPYNLGPGWVGCDFSKAFGKPVKMINDAAMQALGGYKGGAMLFLGLGTGLGSAMIVDGRIEPMELAHLPYRKATYEDYVGLRGLKRYGKKKWRDYVEDVVERLAAALLPDEVVIGGGNAKLLKKVPRHARLGNNANAFAGGFRLWQDPKIRSENPSAAAEPASVTAAKSATRKSAAKNAASAGGNDSAKDTSPRDGVVSSASTRKKKTNSKGVSA